jgi:hypothetical protein
VTAADAVRYLDWRAAECRDRDQHQALCLLLPAVLHALNLKPMRDEEAWAFHRELKNAANKKNGPSATQGPSPLYERLSNRIRNQPR